MDEIKGLCETCINLNKLEYKDKSLVGFKYCWQWAKTTNDEFCGGFSGAVSECSYYLEETSIFKVQKQEEPIKKFNLWAWITGK